MKIVVIKKAAWLSWIIQGAAYFIGLFSCKTVKLTKLRMNDRYDALNSVPEAWTGIWKKDRELVKKLVRWYVGKQDLDCVFQNGKLFIHQKKLVLAASRSKKGLFRLYRWSDVSNCEPELIIFAQGEMREVLPHVTALVFADLTGKAPYSATRSTTEKRQPSRFKGDQKIATSPQAELDLSRWEPVFD